MKKILTIAILALSINAFAQIPTTGLIGWYPFNGNANDMSTNGNNGTNNGAVLTTDRFGNANSAYLFNGSSSFISVPNVALTGNSARSICAWIKTTSTVAKCITQTGGTGVSAGDFNLVMGYGPGSQTQPGKFGMMGYVNDFYPATGVNINDNNWRCVFATYDGSGNIKTYVDGVVDNTGTITYNTVGQINYIGKTGYANNENYWDGTIDDVGYWNRELTPSEIVQIYNTGLCYQTITVTDTLIINAQITGFNPIAYQNTIKIFPNPTNDQITIDFGSNYSTMNGYTLNITNSLSQIVYTTPINQQSTTVNLSTWTGNGIYFVHLIDAQSNTIDIRKIVLQ